MSIKVITDSHSSITQERAAELDVLVLPMPFSIDGEEYFEGKNLTREMFFEKLRGGSDVSTSQPSPESVMELWDEGLRQRDEVVYIPISSGISGSYATAELLSHEPRYEGKVFVVDAGRVSAPMYRSVLDALELAAEGLSGREIMERMNAARENFTIYVALDTLEHLKKGGRISGATAVLGTMLNIKPIAQFDVGELTVYKKCRGMHAARKSMLEVMHSELEGRFKPFADRGEVFLQMAYSTDEATAAEWRAEIEAAFPGMEILSAPLSLGVSCHIGEDALGIGCSCRIPRG